jgi:hypothetical protein
VTRASESPEPTLRPGVPLSVDYSPVFSAAYQLGSPESPRQAALCQRGAPLHVPSLYAPIAIRTPTSILSAASSCMEGSTCE